MFPDWPSSWWSQVLLVLLLHFSLTLSNSRRLDDTCESSHLMSEVSYSNEGEEKK